MKVRHYYTRICPPCWRHVDGRDVGRYAPRRRVGDEARKYRCPACDRLWRWTTPPHYRARYYVPVAASLT